jgi:hypothetical protein
MFGEIVKPVVISGLFVYCSDYVTEVSIALPIIVALMFAVLICTHKR